MNADPPWGRCVVVCISWQNLLDDIFESSDDDSLSSESAICSTVES